MGKLYNTSTTKRELWAIIDQLSDENAKLKEKIGASESKKTKDFFGDFIFKEVTPEDRDAENQSGVEPSESDSLRILCDNITRETIAGIAANDPELATALESIQNQEVPSTVHVQPEIDQEQQRKLRDEEIERRGYYYRPTLLDRIRHLLRPKRRNYYSRYRQAA